MATSIKENEDLDHVEESLIKKYKTALNFTHRDKIIPEVKKKHKCLLCCVHILTNDQLKKIFKDTLKGVLEITDDLDYCDLENSVYDAIERYTDSKFEDIDKTKDYFKDHLSQFLCIYPHKPQIVQAK